MASRLAAGALATVSIVHVALAVVSILLGSWSLALGGAGAVIVGAIILAKRPNNGVGLALLAFGIVTVLSDLSNAYMTRWLEGASLPLDRLVMTVGASVFELVATTGCALLLVYPTGRARGRFSLVLGGILVVGLVGIVSGIAWSWARPLTDIAQQMVVNETSNNPAELAAAATFMLGLPLSVASLVTRYRAATAVEQAQIRWLMFAAAFLFVTSVADNIAGDFDSPRSQVTTGIAFLLFPIAIGVAVTRYRLFEIDRIISRTVSYGLLTAALVGIYVGLVFMLRELLPFRGAFPVAASTLAAALLFNPLRGRLQTWVDRRFNRRRYNTERVAEAFATRLRNAVELTSVTEDLKTVVASTVEPSTTTVWLKGEL